MSKWCFNYETGDYEYIERDGFSINTGKYTYNWDDSEYRQEEKLRKENLWNEDDDMFDLF